MKWYVRALIPLLSVWVLSSCQQKKPSTVTHDSTITDTMVNADFAETSPATARPSFDLNSVRSTNFDLGQFPFFRAPKGYVYRNIELKMKGEEYFLADGKLTPVEGKSFKAELVKDETNAPTAFSMRRVEKSYDTMLSDAGGVRISKDIPTKAEMERIGDEEIYEKERGFTVGFGGIDLNTYVLRNRGAEVWVQLSLNNVYGAICIIQKGAFTDASKFHDARKELAESSHIEVETQSNDSMTLPEDRDTAVQY